MTRDEIQDKLLLINRSGSSLNITDTDGKGIVKCIADSYTITKSEGKDFWILWKAICYDDDIHYSHTAKIVKITVEETVPTNYDGRQWIDVYMVDDLGREMHIEMIEPSSEEDKQATWKKWTAYRNRKADFFKIIDQRILEEHTKIAEDWA